MREQGDQVLSVAASLSCEDRLTHKFEESARVSCNLPIGKLY